jgi:hypothetical protein
MTGDRAVVRVGMAHVESRRYSAAQLPKDAKYQLISAWIAGECYGAPATAVAVDAVVEAQVEPPVGAAAEMLTFGANGAHS